MTAETKIIRDHLIIVGGICLASILQVWIIPQKMIVDPFVHSSMEAVGAVSAFLIGIFLLQKQRLENRSPFSWVIAGVFIMGFFDGYHTLLPPGNDFVLYHSLAVFWGGVFFALSWLPRFAPVTGAGKFRLSTPIGIGTAVLFFTLAGIDTVAIMLENGRFTPLAKLLNFSGGLGFIAGACFFLKAYARTRDPQLYWIAVFGLLQGLGGVDFLYGEMWSSGWWVWHGFRLLAFILVLLKFIYDHYQHQIRLGSALDALEKSETKYRSMVEAMVDPVYICSPGFRVEYMNPAMVRRLGRDATGEVCYLALHGLDHRCDWCVFDPPVIGPSGSDKLVSPLDGRTFRVTHMPISNADGSVSKMIIYRDVTDFLKAVSEKEKAETQLMQAQKLEAIGTLAGGIAHDFNNILFPIIGLTEMLLDKPFDSKVREDLQGILTAGKRAQKLVAQILAFSRKRQNELEPLDLRPILKEVLKLARSTLPPNIRIRRQVDDTAGIVMADAAQFHQVVMNLISNSFHAMEDSGGVLTVSLTRVMPGEDSPDPEKEWVCLIVEDTGAGMDADILDHIFDPYFTTKEQDKGSGLGLAVTHGIVKSFDGEIRVSSQKGGGSRFRIYLPRAADRAPVAAPLSPAREPATGNREKILVVDDEKPVRRLLNAVLASSGYEVVACASGPDALRELQKGPDEFDLVISDLMMPDITGDQLCRAVKNIRDTIPFIIITGADTKNLLTDQPAGGIDRIITKPILKRELLIAVKEALS